MRTIKNSAECPLRIHFVFDLSYTFKYFSISIWTTSCYGVFTLPDTDTDTETETDVDTDKLAQNPMEIFIIVCLCKVWTLSDNSI